MADRGGHNELSGEARLAAQVRTVHGGLHINTPSLMGVALVFAVVGLVLIAVTKRPEPSYEQVSAAPAGTRDSAVVDARTPVREALEIEKEGRPSVVAMAAAEDVLRRVWPREARLRGTRSSPIPRGVWLHADIVLPGAGCAGVVDVVVVDLGEVYSVLVITAER